MSGKRGSLHLGEFRHSLLQIKKTATICLSLFFVAVHSSAYGHSKATLRARCALFFHIRTPSSVQALCLYANMKKQPHGFRKVVFSLVPAVGLEPTRMISPQDFESSASASFTTPAQVLIYHNQALLATDFVKKLQIELKFMPQVTLCVLNYLKFCLNKCDRRCTIVL